MRSDIFLSDWKTVQAGSRTQDICFKFPIVRLLIYMDGQLAGTIPSDNRNKLFGWIFGKRVFGCRFGRE